MLDLFLYTVMILGLACIIPVLSFVLGRPVHDRHKDMPYESGIAPTGTPRVRTAVPYYLVAILFIMFDVEIIFLYPWALNLRELGWKGFAIAGLFMLFLFEGLVYVWTRGGLIWRHLSKTASAKTSSSRS